MNELIDDTGEDIPDAAELIKMRHRVAEMTKHEDDINPEEINKYLAERFGNQKYPTVGALGQGRGEAERRVFGHCQCHLPHAAHFMFSCLLAGQ